METKLEPYNCLICGELDNYASNRVCHNCTAKIWMSEMNYSYVEGILNFYEYVLTTRDPYEDGHSKRVADLAVRLAHALDYSLEFIEKLKYGALFHDVGKLILPVELLNKKFLLDVEFRKVRAHAREGYLLFQKLGINGMILGIIGGHHENYDGTGYPMKLYGTGISDGARIIRICDSSDAMTSTRPYGVQRTRSETLEEMIRCRNEYDPNMLAVFAGLEWR